MIDFFKQIYLTHKWGTLICTAILVVVDLGVMELKEYSILHYWSLTMSAVWCHIQDTSFLGRSYSSTGDTVSILFVLLTVLMLLKIYESNAEKFSSKPRKEWPTVMKPTCYSPYSSHISVHLTHYFSNFFTLPKKIQEEKSFSSWLSQEIFMAPPLYLLFLEW